MKILIYAAAFTLVIASSVPATYGNAPRTTGKVPHIVGAVQFPQTRWRIVRHSFRLEIPQESKALSQLSIEVPSGLTVRNNISVSDQSERRISTNVSVNDSKVMLAFPEPIVPGTTLKVALKDVKISRRSNSWLYSISVRLIGLNADIPIGIVRIRSYS